MEIAEAKQNKEKRMKKKMRTTSEALGTTLSAPTSGLWWYKVLDSGLPLWKFRPTPYCSTNISQATQHRRQDSKTNGKSNL